MSPAASKYILFITIATTWSLASLLGLTLALSLPGARRRLGRVTQFDDFSKAVQ